MTLAQGRLVIWDYEHPCDLNDDICVLMRNYSFSEQQLSVPRYIEENASRLRSKYILFISELSNKKINGTSLVENLSVADGFSFWNMSLIAEKSPYKSRAVYQVIKCFALDEIIQEFELTEIELFSSDAKLIKVIDDYSRKNNYKFNIQNVNHEKIKEQSLIRRIYDIQPEFLKGLLSFRHLLSKNILKIKNKTPKDVESKKAFLCSYFYSLDLNRDVGKINTHQRGFLPSLLRMSKAKLNWLHLYTPSPSTPNLYESLKIINNLDGQEQHQFIEGMISFNSFVKVFNIWIKLSLCYFSLKNISTAFFDESTKLNLWPYYKEEWKRSLLGTTSVQNVAWFVSFDRYMEGIANQKIGFYLWENQAWEQAFLYAWRKHGHGKIIAIPTSLIKFWAIGYFDSYEDNFLSSHKNKYFPDKLCINGPLARKIMIDSGFDNDTLVETEALRYNNLICNQIPKTNTDQTSGENNLLLIGDYNSTQVEKMIQCLKQTSEILSMKLNITLKLHPSCEINNNHDYPLAKESIKTLSEKHEIAFCGNSTSACIDAVAAGMKLIIFDEADDFNHCPIRGLKQLNYVSDSIQMASVIERIQEQDPINLDEIFYLSTDYEKWQLFIDGLFSE